MQLTGGLLAYGLIRFVYPVVGAAPPATPPETSDV